METLTMRGGEVKALKGGKVGGYLCRFGDATTTDLEGEFFTKDTDFGVAWNTDGTTGTKTAVLYAHGLDNTIKTRRLTIESGTLKMDEVGIWVEGQIAQRDAYEKAIAGMVKANKLGWSSGTASHLVVKELVAGTNATWIKEWPLGLDASLTPRPAESRNDAMPIKSVDLATFGESVKGLLWDTPEQMLGDISSAIFSRISDRLWSRMYDILKYNNDPVATRLNNVEAVLDEFEQATLGAINAIYAGATVLTQAEAAESVKQMLGRYAETLPTPDDTDDFATFKAATRLALLRGEHEVLNLTDLTAPTGGGN